MFILRKFNIEKDAVSVFELLNSSQFKLLPNQPMFLNNIHFNRWLEEQLAQFYHDFYVIETSDRATSKIQGFILAYDYRFYDRHCKVFGYHKKGIDDLILKEFVDKLFKEYPLNKIFMETTEINNNLIDSAYSVGFVKEAVLTENKYISGKYYDLIILSLCSQNKRCAQ